MSLLQSKLFSDSRLPSADRQPSVYPTECHFRIVTAGADATEQAITAATAAFEVTEPLTFSRQSAGNCYRSYSLSLQVHSRDEMTLIDAVLKQIPGVRMVL